VFFIQARHPVLAVAELHQDVLAAQLDRHVDPVFAANGIARNRLRLGG
jgi:hypothetical protein